MIFLTYVIASLVGWCPPMPPQPRPPIPKELIAGLLGGLAGAYLVKYALALQGPVTSIDFIAMMIGAFVVGRVFKQLTNWISPSPGNN